VACAWIIAVAPALVTRGLARDWVGDWKVELAGTVRFPDELADAAGKPHRIRGLSGVTWDGDGRWAAVMDNSDALVRFTVELAPDGAPLAIGELSLVTLSARHDYEDLALCSTPLAARFVGAEAGSTGRFIVVCEEDTPALRVARLSDGQLVGSLPLPALLRERRPNRGLEAVAMTADEMHIWTATEEALPADGPAASADAGTVVRLVCIPVAPGGRSKQVAYAVDPPHAFVRLAAGPVLSGVVALVALPDGRLLVLERSGGAGLPPFENRLYLVAPADAPDVTHVGGGLAGRGDLHTRKTLLWRGSLGCNLEGLGLGPAMDAGWRPLIAISDNDGLEAPAVLAAFRLTSP
jgi:hypothetical protein